ncbi:MAG: hypothetical protein L0211_16740 [Planctomycetaceae bacterium]|nr:hypothetical protein [Planctomycetaceae bacterium]
MMTLFLLLVFLATAGLIWLHGLWGAAVTLINLMIAMLIAMNLFEPISDALQNNADASFEYLYDFVVLWMTFFFTFGFLRLVTDMLSKTRVKFDMPVEMAGRSILAIWCGWLMVCFTAFSLMMAPLNSETPLGAWASPKDGAMVFSPDRLWLGFVHSRSRGALSRGKIEGGPDAHPDDVSLNVETFDPHGEFPIKYHDRRVKYAEEEQMRVAQ